MKCDSRKSLRSLNQNTVHTSEKTLQIWKRQMSKRPICSASALVKIAPQLQNIALSSNQVMDMLWLGYTVHIYKHKQIRQHKKQKALLCTVK